MRYLKKMTQVGFVLAAIVCCATSAQAQITVSGPTIDRSTQGDWRNVYGECFYLLPDNPFTEVEVPIGPDFYSVAPGQYANVICPGGALLPDVDWRVFLNDSVSEDPEANAFTWHFGEDYPNPAGSAQWNPCRNDFFAATFDNDLHLFDPLSIELVVDASGDIQLAYYILDGENICRDIEWTLYVDGVQEATGTLEDYAAGAYLVFNIDGLPGTGTTILFEGKDAPGDPTCAGNPPYVGVNTHISGVFISGSDVCAGPFCGDGILDGGEECDDGNTADGDGCSANCTVEPPCGDGVLDAGEECDDGNTMNGDGCSETCTVETFCGDGVLDAGEECDDGNTMNGDGCSATCTTEVQPACGDGILQDGEECDDGNNIDGDGCSENCSIEPACGDGVIDAGEQCDDGNNIDGDGCSSSCEVETDGEGCTPGYWKQPHHFDSWVGYAPDDLFSDVFGRVITIRVPTRIQGMRSEQPVSRIGHDGRLGKLRNGQTAIDAFPIHFDDRDSASARANQIEVTDPTLLEALNARGGGINALARHAVAGLLSATSVDYAYSTAVVIARVQAAIDAGGAQVNILKDDLDEANNAGCPLN